jgi:small subunit ribosomal protein S6
LQPLEKQEGYIQRKAMNQYETTIILTPLLSEEVSKEVITKFRKILTDNGAEIVNEDNWGLRKLAYPINKKTTGYYHLTEFKAAGDLVGKLEIEYKRDERVVRFLTVSLDKHAVSYNERKRTGTLAPKNTTAKILKLEGETHHG